jgi:hypothetical protein
MLDRGIASKRGANQLVKRVVAADILTHNA